MSGLVAFGDGIEKREEERMMKLGLAAIGLSVLCLIAALGFGAPVWVNGLGLVSGIAGLVLLGRAKKDGGA